MNNLNANGPEIRAAFENISNSSLQQKTEGILFLKSITATDQTGIDLLVSGVRIPNIDIQINSALALGRITSQSPSAIQALQTLLEDRGLNSLARHSAAAALVEMCSPEATEAMVSSIRKISQEPEEHSSFLPSILKTFASVGSLGLPHLALFEGLKTTFNQSKATDGMANINIARIELSRAIERNFRHFINRSQYQSPHFGAYLNDNCELPAINEYSESLGEFKLQFDERACFSINSWARGPLLIESDTRVVFLQPINHTRKPLVIICHDEMSHNFLLVDVQDVVKQISNHLGTKVLDFDWATYSSPTKDNSNYEGSLRITDYKSPAMILNSIESEFKIGTSYRDITTYLRTAPNPPSGFYDFSVDSAKALANRRNRIISQGNHH
jgi:hypothetical protein